MQFYKFGSLSFLCLWVITFSFFLGKAGNWFLYVWIIILSNIPSYTAAFPYKNWWSGRSTNTAALCLPGTNKKWINPISLSKLSTSNLCYKMFHNHLFTVIMLKRNAHTNSFIGKCQKKQNMQRTSFIFIQTISSL